MKRLFLAMLIALFGLILTGLASTPAFAQGWVPCDANGNTTDANGNPIPNELGGQPSGSASTNVHSGVEHPSPTDAPWLYGGGLGPFAYGLSVSAGFTGGARGTITVNETDPLVAYLKPSTPLTNPPPYIDVLLTTSTLLSVPQGAASISDGFPQDDLSASSSANLSGGSLVLERAAVGSSQIAEVTLNAQGMAQSNSVGMVTASLAASVTQDSRDVTISSFMDPNYYKGPNNTPTLVPSSLDGSETVDSAVYWNSATGTWESDGYFDANAKNFKNPYYAWSFSGGSLLSTSSSLPGGSSSINLKMVFGGQPATNSMGMQSSVRVAVTDEPSAGDGATGANTYTVNWHYPMEGWNNYSSGTSFWQGSTLQQQTSGNYNGNANCTYATTDAENGANTALADMFTAGAGLVDPPWAGFLTAAGLVFSSTQPTQPISTSVNFNDAWGNGPGPGVLSTWDQAPLDNTPATMELYSMEPEIFSQYIPEFFKGDGWGTNGYTGQVLENYDKFTGRIQDAGAFTRNN